MSSNKTMKNKLVNSMRATKAGTSKSDTDSVEKEAPTVKKASTQSPKAKPGKKKSASKPASSGFSSSCRVWPD